MAEPHRGQSRNPYTDDNGRSLVARLATAPEGSFGPLRFRLPLRTVMPVDAPAPPSQQLIDDLHRLVESIGGFARAVRPGDTVVLKPNFNSGDPPPNCTDLPLLEALIGLLRDYGARRVIVGESSRHPPTSTRYEMRRAGVFDVCRRAGAEVAIFPEGEWMPVRLRGGMFKWVEVARPLLECDRLIYACCLKTHWLSKFSISIKHSVGCVRPRHRARLHFGGRFEERVAELATAVTPSLVIVDGRLCYTRGGPSYGATREANVLLASGDRVAIDVQGIREIQRIPGNALAADAWSYRQLRHAIALGIGAASDAEIVIRNAAEQTGRSGNERIVPLAL
jgi:uncharacterized protein (DUF362 family)